MNTASRLKTAAFACIWLISPGGAAMEAHRQSITILFTGDRHGQVEPWIGWEEPMVGKTVGGMDRLAMVANQVRREVGEENVLLLDSGDAIGDSFIAAATKGRAVIELMNAAGYDAMTIGNHEPDFGVEELRLCISEAQFPVIAANLFEADGTLFTKPYVVRRMAALRLAFSGWLMKIRPLPPPEKIFRGWHSGTRSRAPGKPSPK